MVFRDRWADCATCGNRFLFTVELQRSVQQTGEGEDSALLCRNCAPRGEGGVPQAVMKLDPETGHWIGSVKWFDVEKGYGFIDRGDGTDVFFHRTSLLIDPSELAEGQSVTYDVEETVKGSQAVEVRLYQM